MAENTTGPMAGKTRPNNRRHERHRQGHSRRPGRAGRLGRHHRPRPRPDPGRGGRHRQYLKQPGGRRVPRRHIVASRGTTAGPRGPATRPGAGLCGGVGEQEYRADLEAPTTRCRGTGGAACRSGRPAAPSNAQDRCVTGTVLSSDSFLWPAASGTPRSTGICRMLICQGRGRRNACNTVLRMFDGLGF
jgi:hypothetical protein